MNNRVLLTLAAFPLTACGAVQGGSNSMPQTPQAVQVETGSGVYQMESIPETRFSTDVVQAPRDAVWAALPAVYEELGLEVKAVNPGRWEIGNRDQRLSRRLADRQLSDFLDCGTNPIGAPAADVYGVRLDLLTRIADAGGSTTVQTRMTGVATPRGGGGSPARCNSTGRLEAEIIERLNARLQPAG